MEVVFLATTTPPAWSAPVATAISASIAAEVVTRAAPTTAPARAAIEFFFLIVLKIEAIVFVSHWKCPPMMCFL
jgi:hypothetical protein